MSAHLDTKESAERLALTIKRYWARLHQSVDVQVKPVIVEKDGKLKIAYTLQSDLFNGQPRPYKPVLA